MTVANQTPHETEALRVADELNKAGCWASATVLQERVASRGIHDDRDLRETLAFIGRRPEQIGESIRRVHAALENADTIPATGEGW